MERERWSLLYALACRLSQGLSEGYKFSAAWIVGVFLWAVVHDRPVRWACERRNWPAELIPRGLPAQSTMSRRLRSRAVQRLLERMEEHLRGDEQDEWVKLIDAKPLLVGAHSKDADARRGRASGGSWKGYKVFTLWGQRALPIAWEVEAMNTSEQTMARWLLPHLEGGGYVLGDKLYDANALYDEAGRRRHQLVAQRKKPKAGLGHHRHSPYRLRSIELLKSAFGKALYRQRSAIERRYGQWTNFGGGLAPLPNWVRTLRRVRLWVQAKFLIHAIRLQAQQPPQQLAIA